MKRSQTEKGRVYWKETVFEGYYSTCWECSFLMRDPDYRGEGYVYDQKRKWLRESIESYLKETPEPKPYIIGLDDLLPRQIFKRLLENPNKKFRFKIIAETEEI